MGLYVDIEKKLNNMTLRVQFDTGVESGITGILGASGCGKSMTLKCIAGIVKPDRGRIILNGRTLLDTEQGINIKIQDRRVGYLFQNYALFPNMTVEENIQIACKRRGQDLPNPLDFYLELLQIQELRMHYPKQLSGGQQQRVALARILASRPDALLLDEPFSSLDSFLKDELQIELLHLLQEYYGDVLMVTHSRDEVYRFCNQIHVLDQGQVVISGGTKEIFENPQVIGAAQLTGCKNIKAANRIDAHHIEVPDWKITLELQQEIPIWTTAMGIRAHYLQPVQNGVGMNIIKCKWNHILEDPFEITGILENGIWWKISKEEWVTNLQRQMPQWLRIPEESILFLREGVHEKCSIGIVGSRK